MGRIVLNRILIEGNRLEYRYSISDDLAEFFCPETPYYMEYCVDGSPVDLLSVPDGILAVPFLCNVLPILWITNSELVLPELDEVFFNSIPAFKKGYVEMYPDAEFGGTLSIGKLVNTVPEETGKSGLFFSAGLDAYCSLVRHMDEKPELVALWGADIAVDNESGWNVLHGVLQEAAQKYQLPLVTIRTSFRKVINSGNLTNRFFTVLHDEWWHAAQHGPAIIGHAAPLSWLHGISTQYIASSFSPEDGSVTCCSYPTIDNYIRFCNCKVVHDGFELTRQKKIDVIADYCKRTGDRIQLHVCWVKQDGKNCCKCEKCMRTIAEFWSSGENPQEYGFTYDDNLYADMRAYMTTSFEYNPWVKKLWVQIQQSFAENKSKLQAMGIYEQTKWIETFDFTHPERYWKRRVIKLWHSANLWRRMRPVLGRMKRKLLR